MTMPDLTVSLVEGPDDVPTFVDWLKATLSSGRTIAVDTETRSVDELWHPGSHCRLWQVGTSEDGWAIPSREWHALVGWACEQIAKAHNQIIMANAKYDMHTMAREGWALPPWHRVEDVLVLHTLVRAGEEYHNLKGAAVEELGEWAGQGQSTLKTVMKKNGWDWGTIPVDHPALWVYGVMDTCLTVLLWEALLPVPAWYHIEQSYQEICFGMEQRGVLLDEAAVMRADEYWGAQVADLGAQLSALGVTDPLSSKKVDQAFRTLGLEPFAFSEKTGDPSYAKAVLELVADQWDGSAVAEAASLLIRYRQAASWRSLFGAKLLNFVAEDGLVHPSIKTLGARTGRSSITNPPLQIIPHQKITRDMFIPEHGRKLVAVDYSSQEVRVQAALSGDKAMMAFFDGEENDYHQYVADMAGIPRSAAKTVNYARAYGAGVGKLASAAGATAEEMEQYLAEIDRAFPRAIEWKDEVTAEAEASEPFRHVVTPYGRVVRLDEGHEYTQAANSIIQGHGADVLKLAATRLAAAGYSEALVLPVHDEIIAQCPPEEVEQLSRDFEEIMRDDLLPVPLVAEASEPLDRWGDKYDE